MKTKRLITFLVSLLFTFANAQEDLKPLKIYHEKDDMTGKEYFYASRRMVYADTVTKHGKLQVEGFGVNLSFHKKKDELQVSGLEAKCSTLDCVENCSIIIMFEDDTKIEKKSWNSFNCQGNAYFGLGKKDIELLSSKNVKKIRITNGRNYKSVTGEIDETDYFINMIGLLRDNKIDEKNHNR